MKKNSGVTIIVIIAVIALAIILMNLPKVSPEQATAKCIGENSELYTQTGCHACQIQEEMFGDNVQYLNIINCWTERDKCGDIQWTPTWVINGEKYEDIQTIEKLKELTGCE